MHVIRFGKPDFVILDRYSLCRALSSFSNNFR